LMYFFGHSLLYNVYDRVIVSSVPIRGISGRLIPFEEEKKYPNMKAEILKRFFYNSKTPKRTLLEQFRKMIKKQSFKKKEWEGKKFRVQVSYEGENDNSFNNFQMTKNNFLNFIGQSASFAFSYKLESPILPFMMNASLTNTTISRFDFATKLYNKIDVKLPEPDFNIKIFHHGWEFAEEDTEQKNIKDVILGMGVEIEIYDTFEEKVIYNQYYFAEQRYRENNNKIQRSDAAKVCELTEALLERAFMSIKDKSYRNKIINGDQLISPQRKTIFQIDTEKPKEVDKQSDNVLKQLPKVNEF